MIFKRKEKPKVDDDIILRANIAQGIKILYLDRKRLFYPENNHYEKLNDTFDHIIKNLRELEKKKPRMLVIGKNGFEYELLDSKMIDTLEDYFKFLLLLPPPNSIFTRWKKSVEIGKMHVPTLSYMLHSILTYKLPDYWMDKMDEYTDIAGAIIEVINKGSNNEKLIDVTDQAKKNIENKVDKEREKVYKKKILEWLRLNLII
ncbi:hypothetical protein M1384_03860 [Candidatus Parvarchaeota archaeon]|jgi:hypothetical protein|nr:hypothetical protein [Candidatus Parvarchaeota archaeon]